MLSANHTGRIVYTGESDNPKCPPGFETGDFFTTEPWSFNEETLILLFTGDDYFDTYNVFDVTETTLILKGSGLFTCCDPAISNFTGGYLVFERE